MVFSIILALIIFCALIFIHELGHFLAAKWAKVKVNEFAIGMGPVIFKKQGKETLYSIRLFPIGGFCQMEGEDEESDDVNAFNNKSTPKKILIVIAGAAMNILLGVILVFSMVITAPRLASTEIAKFDEKAISNTSLQEGDKIVKINDQSIHIAQDIQFAFARNIHAEPMDFTVVRDGKKVELSGVKFPSQKIDEKYTVFMWDFVVKAEEKNVLNVLNHTAWESYSFVRSIWSSLADLITGKVGFDAVSGPVGITKAIGDAAQSSVSDVIFLITLITINLGVFNLLPLPALDGGRLLFLIYELITKKKVNQKVEGTIHFIGFALLMLLTVFVLFNDIFKLF